MNSVIHLRNGRMQRYPQTFGEGVTWCGKKLLGQPESAGEGLEAFTSYGTRHVVTTDPAQVSCAACSKTFGTAYAEAFPEGPKPIATFRLDDPAEVARAKAVLSPEALNGFFGPSGGGMAAFMDAVEQL